MSWRNLLHAFDASSLVYLWDNYPNDQFPTLWDWIGGEIDSGKIRVSSVALDQVCDKFPDCGNWIKQFKVNMLPVTNKVVETAMLIKDVLEIEGDKYRGGVDEEDIFIISVAKVNSLPLVTDEQPQSNLPKAKANYKIPAVCCLPEVNVECINALEWIKRSGKVF